MTDKAQTDAAQRLQLPKLINDSQNNNYGEWETKAYHVLCSWDLLKFIEGLEANPPPILPLRANQSFHGTTDKGVVTIVHVQGNKEEHDKAVTDTLPWITGNNLCLSKIVNTVPNL